MSKPVFYCILFVLSGILMRFGLIQMHHRDFKFFLLVFIVIAAVFLWALNRIERRYPTYNREEDQFSAGAILDA